MRVVRIYQIELGINAKKARDLLKTIRRYSSLRWKEHQREKCKNRGKK